MLLVQILVVLQLGHLLSLQIKFLLLSQPATRCIWFGMMRQCPWSVVSECNSMLSFCNAAVVICYFIFWYGLQNLQEERRMSLMKYQVHDETSQVSYNYFCNIIHSTGYGVASNQMGRLYILYFSYSIVSACYMFQVVFQKMHKFSFSSVLKKKYYAFWRTSN